MLKNTESYWYLYETTELAVLRFSFNCRHCLKHCHLNQWPTLLFKARQRIKSREHSKDRVQKWGF